jgi:AcrR family transcriptional regulator
MEKTDPTTEQRILSAAKKVFHSKGYDGARMQEIANEAGVNKSLVHYYFRSKDNIFQAVFEDAFGILLQKINEIFMSDLALVKKIELFVGYYIVFLSRNSYLPLFILNGLYEKPEVIKKLLKKNQLSPEHLMETIRRQVRGEMNLDIDPYHLYINILALCIFPVVAKPLLQAVFGFSTEMMNNFYDEREKLVPEFIFNALKGYENNPVI